MNISECNALNDLPSEIYILTTLVKLGVPVSDFYFNNIRNKFPKYWNSKGHFDPFFQHRHFMKELFPALLVLIKKASL
jgi:hypothetical protein